MSPTPTIGGDVAELRADVDALSGTAWGGITGTLSSQTDLQTVLNSKSEFSGSYVDLTNKPTLGDAAAKNTGTIAGTVAAGDHTHPGGAVSWGDVGGTLSNQTDLQTALDGKQATGSYEPANANIQAHIGSVSNPHSVTKAQVGLANVDNTSDAAKPVSTATQTALDAKEPANANIQAHVVSAHAPSNAQKNSDILKAEIEAKLTGEISSHTHAGGSGAGQLSLAFVADGAALALTNMAVALQFLGNSHRFATKADLTSYTQVRLIVNKQATAGAAASKIILRYIGAFSTTAASWVDIGASEVSVAINVQNTVLVTAWINLAALAKVDVFVCPLMSGGDGALDPTVGHIEAQFK